MDSICSYYVAELEAEILELEKQRIEEKIESLKELEKDLAEYNNTPKS